MKGFLIFSIFRFPFLQVLCGESFLKEKFNDESYFSYADFASAFFVLL